MLINIMDAFQTVVYARGAKKQSYKTSLMITRCRHSP